MERKCIKCGNAMEKGSRIDSTYGATVTENWVPEVFFNGKEMRTGFGLRKLFKALGKRVSTYACPNCGYLESYIDKKENK